MFEGDGAAAGTIDLAQDLSSLSTGSNGLLLLGVDYTVPIHGVRLWLLELPSAT